MRCYIAAPFIHKDAAAEAKAKFEAAGLTVVARWITEDLGLTNDDVGKPEHDAVLQQRALEDMEDVLGADVFVLLNLAKSEGKATEFGMAYTSAIPIILVGPRTGNVFYLLPDVYRADTVEAAIAGIQRAANLEIVPADADEVTSEG